MQTAGRSGGGGAGSLAAATLLLALLLALTPAAFAQTSVGASTKKSGGSIAHCTAYSTTPPSVGASHKKGSSTPAKYCAQCAAGYILNASGLSCGEFLLLLFRERSGPFSLSVVALLTACLKQKQQNKHT